MLKSYFIYSVVCSIVDLAQKIIKMKDLICYLFHKKIKITLEKDDKSDMITTSAKKCTKCNICFYEYYWRWKR